MQIYKILHKSAPVYLHNMFEYAISVTGRDNFYANRDAKHYFYTMFARFCI